MDLCTEAKEILGVVHYVYLGIIIVVPIILILVGMIDLAKAVTEKKDEKIKEAQQSLVKKAVSAALVFLVPFLVAIIMRAVSSGGEYKACWDIIVKGNRSTSSD